MRAAPSLVLAACLSTTFLAGCYSPAGGYYPRSNSTFTYISTPSTPVTVTVLDVRSNEAFFRMEVPVGKQLTFHFVSGGGDEPVYRPDHMQWELFDAGTTIGSLTNRVSCPPANSRRIDLAYRPSLEYAPEPPETDLRVDRPEERPEWWTEKGGPAPKKTKPSLYE